MNISYEMAMQFVSPFLFYLGAINALSIIIFSLDKYKSVKGAWRVPEKTLLLLAALGGSIIIWFARKWIRHKTRKQPFNKQLLAIVLIQFIACIVFGWQLIADKLL